MKTPTGTDEKDLLIKLRDGDEKAFNHIYQQYKKPITSNLFKLLKEKELVEDTLQEIFCRLWEKRATINPEQPLSGYLFRISSNLAHDHFRRLVRDVQLAEVFWEALLASRSNTETATQQEMDEALYKVIDMLPPQRKRVFILCKFESKSYKEVSRLLNISVPAVNDHISKANKFLKAHYPKMITLVGYYVAVHILKDII